MTREAKAADILKAHRATAKVAKARELSPAFDAECRAAEQPVGFWQWAGYVHGRLRHDCGYLKMLALAGMILFLVWIAPFIWLLVKMFLILIPIWFFTTLGGPRRTPYGSIGVILRKQVSIFRTQSPFPGEKCLCHFPEVCVIAARGT